ncbi:MAG: V-type ATP synthase subunit E [Synergistaceae bacterium]|jgi:V/A-type H+-transporting ATPase subunit E|nr:V-type ATP synthase subunit E [Synergistaceae bacterium]
MSLAQITEKIELDARAEAEKILERSREQETGIRRSAEAEVKKLEDAAKSRFDRERPEIFKRRDIVARLDVHKIHLDAQRRLIGDVFREGLERLKNLDKGKYLAFCRGLLKEAVESGDEVMEISSGEKYIDSGWLGEFNNANGTKITLSNERRDFSGGFILNKGRIRINCSWEMLMQAAQERLENEVVYRLFSA